MLTLGKVFSCRRARRSRLCAVSLKHSVNGWRDQMTAFIGRREFITLLGGAAAGWPLAAHAQQAERMRRIGVFFAGAADASDTDTRSRLAAFQHGLQQLGWSDGRNIQIDYRRGRGRPRGYT